MRNKFISIYNLQEDNNHSIFHNGRCHLFWDNINIEWSLFSKHHDYFNLSLDIGDSEDNNETAIHVRLPYLGFLYVGINTFLTIYKPRELGISIDKECIRFRPFSKTWESNSTDILKSFGLRFPWVLTRYKSEVLSHDLSTVVYTNQDNDKKTKWIDRWHEEREIAKTVSKDYDFTYVRKNGEIQKTIATVYATANYWRSIAYPIFRFKKKETYIDISFKDQIGEGVDDWKGGVLGCSYKLNENETIEQCLKRMEKTEKF